MPERINAVHQQPSTQIVFLKPLPGPDSAHSQDFLERIAAICHPIMKAHHLRIMTLEEHEPNREFIGRNFNAGEIIQLVLKARNTGHWLSFRSVQMVMMHELAHCLQMNHGREFWKVNAVFKNELRALWEKGYTGEGIWGRGRTLLSGEYDQGGALTDEVLPAQLCGGAFRSRGRRRKRRRNNGIASELGETFAEKKQRRIEKKFGVNGTALGGDEERRVKLENGQKVKGNPRVANSGRGRELRVAAALARLGQQKEGDTKKEEFKTKEEGREDAESETTDDEEEYEEVDEGSIALDLDGSEIKDANGQSMIRVCEGIYQDDENVKQEMEELQGLNGIQEDNHLMSQNGKLSSLQDVSKTSSSPKNLEKTNKMPSMANSDPGRSRNDPKNGDCGLSINREITCPICSMSNDIDALLCGACSHVLDTNKVKKFWRCHSNTCKMSAYINAEDNGLCGICGSRKLSDAPG